MVAISSLGVVDGEKSVSSPPTDIRAIRGVDRKILALAVPALGALLAEPLFVLADTAIVGRLGTAQLAALALASSVLVTVVGLCVFLAYSTTSVVARLLGAGRRQAALQAGVDGLWLALGVGIAIAALLIVGAPTILNWLGAADDVVGLATTYVRWSAPGVPGMLIVLAATGVLRGLQDTRTPLVVAATGAGLNVVLNLVLVYGCALGIRGSAIGTATTQLLMGAVLAGVVARGARHHGANLRPHRQGIGRSARSGVPLLVRTLSLRVAILLTVVVATGMGDVTLAGHQVVNSVWGLIAFGLDALAIAAQALVGHALGASDATTTRRVLHRTLQWGVGVGAVLGATVAASGWWLAMLFTTDPAVRHAIALGLLVCGLLMPLAGWVFVLDGVLIGAGDGRYLAWAGALTVVIYTPVALAVQHWAPPGAAGLAWLWAGFAGVFMLARAATTGWRARGDDWMVLGTPQG